MAPTWVQLGGEGCVTIEVVMIVWRTVGGDYDEWVMKCGELTGKKGEINCITTFEIHRLVPLLSDRDICLKKAEYIK